MHFNQFAFVGEFQNCVSHEQRPHQEQRNRCKTQVKRQEFSYVAQAGFEMPCLSLHSQLEMEIFVQENLGSNSSELLVEAVGEWCPYILKISMCLLK